MIETDKTLKLALELGKMGIWDWDLVKETFSWSDTAQPPFGFEEGRTTGSLKDFLEHIYPPDRKKVLANLKKAVKNLGSYQDEFRIVWPDESLHWIFKKGEVLYDGKGKPVRMLGISMDITERKDEERRREHLLTIASHELRAALSSIKVFTHLLNSNLANKLDAKSSLYLSRIDNKTDLLNYLINDVLDLTRIRQGKLDLFYEQFDFNLFLREIVSDFKILAKDFEIILKGKVKNKVRADKNRLEQVILNLLRNAQKYSSRQKKLLLGLSKKMVWQE